MVATTIHLTQMDPIVPTMGWNGNSLALHDDSLEVNILIQTQRAEA